MKNHRNVLRMIALLMAMTFLFAASVTVHADEAEKKTVTFSRPEDLLNLDPHDHAHLSNYIVNRCIYDTLLDSDEEGNIIPSLATEYVVADDELSITLKLRDDVDFHNGEHFNAECAAVSFNRIVENQLRFVSNWSTLDNAEVLDEYEVRLNFTEPTANAFINLTLVPIIPAQAYAEQGDALFESPIGSGPFKFVEWLPKQRVTLVKNENYWGEPAKIDELVYLPLTEDSTRVAALLAGEIDVATVIPPDQVELLQQDPTLILEKVPAWDQTYLMFNCARDPFTDSRVREAVSIAIDRQAIVDAIVGSRASNQAIPEGVPGFDSSLPPISQDIERAKQLVEEAGATGKEIVIYAGEGTYAKTNETLTVISEWINETGLKCSFQTMDTATFAEVRSVGDYDLFFVGGASMSGSFCNMLNSRIVRDIYKTGYQNEALLETCDKALHTFDMEQSRQNLTEACKLMLEDSGPWTFIYQMENINCYRDGISGVYFQGDGVTDLRRVEKN